jgi:uncharacterized protein (DUF4415 family)
LRARKDAARSARSERTAKKEQNIKPKKIDYSEIPALSDKRISQMRRGGRPTVGDEPRRLIAIRLDAKVLSWLRKTTEKKGLPYQSLVNGILAEEMRKAS